MSLKNMMRNSSLLMAVLAAGAVGIAGILHLEIAAEVIALSPFAAGVFIAFGVPQVFWIIPTISRWGKKWHITGIAYNAGFIGFFLMTLVPNPVTGIAIPPVTTDIVIEILQGAYVALSAAMLVYERKRDHISVRERVDTA